MTRTQDQIDEILNERDEIRITRDLDGSVRIRTYEGGSKADDNLAETFDEALDRIHTDL